MPRRLEADDLDALWADMNGGSAAKKPAISPAATTATVAAPPAAPAVDVSKLLAELQSAHTPEVATETVKFAGVDVQVAVVVPKNNNKGTPDNVANLINQLKGKTRQINSVQKSELDWEAHKAQDKLVGDELQQHMRGGTYLEKQSFLKRAELREYELERQGKTRRK